MRAAARAHGPALTPAVTPEVGPTPIRVHFALGLEAALGQTLTDLARLSNDALIETNDPRLVAQILAIRRRAVEGLENLRAAGDARRRACFRSRRLTQSLRELTARFQAQTRTLTELRAPTHEPVLPDEVAWALYAVADEALESLERRSRATGVVMILRAGGEEVSMSIRDDGVGLLARQGSGWRASPHAALRAMRQAMETVGGVISVTQARPRGLLVRVVVPLHVA